MKPCDRQSETLRGLSSGQWSAALRQHAEECETCRLDIYLFSAVKKILRTTEEKASLPYYRWIIVQSGIQKDITNNKRLHRVSSLTIGVTIAACILIVTGIYGALGFSPDTFVKHLTLTDISLVGVMIILWFTSEFQLQMFLKQKTQPE